MKTRLELDERLCGCKSKRTETYLACENAQNALMQIHDGEIAPLVPIDNRIGVQTDNEIIAEGAGFFEKIEMTDMEQIKCSSNVYLKEKCCIFLNC